MGRQQHFGVLKRLISDNEGNFGVIAAFLIPVGLAAGELSMNVATLMTAKAKLQATADAAALAAGAAIVNQGMSVDDAKTLALNFVKGQLSSELSSIQTEQAKGSGNAYGSFDIGSCTNVTVTQTAGAGNTQNYLVKVNTCLDTQFALFGAIGASKVQQVNVSGSALSSTASQKALSMYLVLDRSGSMADNTSTVTGTTAYTYSCGRRQTCTGTQTTYLTKIDALKQAAGNLMTVIAKADPDAYYARLGAVSFNSAMDTPQALSWGTTAVGNYINALSAYGGTDSSAAMNQAYTSLNSATENALHLSKNGQTPDKYIVFMTDGENNYASATTATQATCDKAKAAGIQIYSIGFMAPAAGQALLQYCATDAKHYFDAQSADDMFAAFKYIGEQTLSATTRLTQ